MQGSEDVMEQVFDAEAKAVEKSLRGGGKIGAERGGTIVPDSVVAELHRIEA